MKLSTASRFCEFELSQEEDVAGRTVNPYTLAYLQNKIAAYANACVQFEYDLEKPLQPQIIEHERLKAQVSVLEELLREFQTPEQPAEQSAS